jgi:hypothetical protein
MITLKSLASHGDLRTWTAYACSGDGHGQAVHAEIGTGRVVIAIAGRIYDCDRETPSAVEALSIGEIRGMMLAALDLDRSIAPIN